MHLNMETEYQLLIHPLYPHSIVKAELLVYTPAYIDKLIQQATYFCILSYFQLLSGKTF